MSVQTHRAVSFASWSDFLDRTAGEDREFLPEEAVDRFPAVCCGMANGTGGWIVFGAAWEEEAPVLLGLSDPSGLERRLKAALAGERTLSADTVSAFRALDAGGVPLLLARVDPAEWHRRPVCVGGDTLRGVYRRIEGIDLVSGRRTRFRYALDALERLRGESAVPGLSVADLHEESVASFREAVTARRPEWRALSPEAFLARTLVLADGALTRAGHLLLGKKATRVRAVFLGPSGEEDIFEVRSLWKAYADLLPRFCSGLSAACAAALRECFVNALVHADHDEGFVRATMEPDSVRIENPGLPRCRPGEALCRNARLMRMFRLAGAAGDAGRGLAAVRAYRPGFGLKQDLLELATVAELELERVAVPSEAVRALSEGMSLPVVSLEARPGEGERDAPEELRGTARDAGEDESSPAPEEIVAAEASASEFLVALPAGGAEPDAVSGEEAGDGEAVPESNEGVPSELEEEAKTREESSDEDAEPETGKPAAPEPLEEEAARTGKRFAFGNAAEDLELAVARMRRGEGLPHGPGEPPEWEVGL